MFKCQTNNQLIPMNPTHTHTLAKPLLILHRIENEIHKKTPLTTEASHHGIGYRVTYRAVIQNMWRTEVKTENTSITWIFKTEIDGFKQTCIFSVCS